jgi:hypothetical protein
MTGNGTSRKESGLYLTLDRNIWITKHSRYTASERLKNKHIYSQYTIAILSIYVLSLSIAPKFIFHSNQNLDSINFVNILLSICIIVVSLLESNNNYGLKAERLYNCANELNALLQQLKMVPDGDANFSEKVELVSKQYSDILLKYNDNHSHHDYDLFRARNAKEFKDEIQQSILFWYYCKHYFMSYAFYLVLIIIPIIYIIIAYVV